MWIAIFAAITLANVVCFAVFGELNATIKVTNGIVALVSAVCLGCCIGEYICQRIERTLGE